MNKCEWKDGELDRCDKSRQWLSIESGPNGMIIFLRNSTFIVDYCPCCGADIRKPEFIKGDDMKYKKGDRVKVWSLPSFHHGGFLKGVSAVVHQDQMGDSVLVEVERNFDGKIKLDPAYEVYSQQLERIEESAEPEKPLIVKSGETFVMEKENINYLCITPSSSLERELILSLEPAGISRWKPFSEIEKEGLTDEIAKLRPIVHLDKNSFKYKLWGVSDCVCILEDSTNSIFWRNYPEVGLATPHELQESE